MLLAILAWSTAQDVRAQIPGAPTIPTNARWVQGTAESPPNAFGGTIGRRVEFLRLPKVGRMPFEPPPGVPPMKPSHRASGYSNGQSLPQIPAGFQGLGASPKESASTASILDGQSDASVEIELTNSVSQRTGSTLSSGRRIQFPSVPTAQQDTANEGVAAKPADDFRPRGSAVYDFKPPQIRRNESGSQSPFHMTSLPQVVQSPWDTQSADSANSNAADQDPLVFSDAKSGLPTVPNGGLSEGELPQKKPGVKQANPANKPRGFAADPEKWLKKNKDSNEISIEEVGRLIKQGRIISNRPTVPLGLQEILALALANSKNINVLRIQPAEDRQNVNREFGQFDWAAFVETLFSQDAQPVGNVGQTNLAINQVRNDQNAVEFGVRKQTIYGGEITLSEVLGTADSNSGLLDPEEPGNSQIRITFTQELLRDRGRDVVLSQALIASLNADISHAQSFATISELLRDVLLQYWDLYQRRGDYFIQLSLIGWAEETLKLLESRGKIDAEQNSIEQARALLFEARANLENARAAVLISQDELYRLVNAPQIDSNIFEILPIEPPKTTWNRYDVSTELQQALSSRAEVTQKLLEIRAAAVAQQVSLNQLLPRLTFSLESSLNGIDDDRDVFGAFSNMVDVDPSYAAGLNFEIFLANRAARAQNKQAELAIRRLNFEYEDQIEQVRLDVATAIRTLNASTAILEQRYRTLQARMEEIEYLRIRRDVIPQQGVSPSLLLEQFFQAINRLVVSQQAFVSAVRDQQSAMADLLQAKGVLLDVSQVPRDIYLAVPSLRKARKEQRAQRGQFIKEAYDRVVIPGRRNRLPTRR